MPAPGSGPGGSAQARLQHDRALREVVQAKLELEWSPQQIAAHLRVAYPDRPDWHLCHETIYQALYHGGKGGLSRQLTRRLRTGRPLRKRRRRADQRRIRFVAPALLIDHRPADRGAARSGRRLGRRPDRRADEPVGDRHPGRPHQPLPASWCTCPTGTAPNSCWLALRSGADDAAGRRPG